MPPHVTTISKRAAPMLVAILLAVVVAFCLRSLHEARSALAEGPRTAAVSTGLAASLVTLRSKLSPFESVVNASEFEAAVQFASDVYVLSSSTLFRYSDGSLQQTWHTGKELPPIRLTGLVVRAGIGNPELWIATEGAGILIFDGRSVRQLLPKEPTLRRISALLPMPNGRVLVGTPGRGLLVSDGASLQVFHPQLSKAEVTALAGDGEQVWIGTRADGAWLWKGGEAQHFLADLPDRQVLSLAAEGDAAWIGTPLGVAEFKNGKFNRHLAGGVFAQALTAHQGKLWIGTVDQGVFSVPLTVQKTRPQLSFEAGEVTSIASFAHLGPALAAVESHALTEVPGQHPLLTAAENSLTSSHVTALHQDSRGRLWIGYFDRGIDSLSYAGPGSVLHVEDDTLFCVNRIKESPTDKSVWVATANGLAVFDLSGRVRQVLTRESGLIASNVTDFLFRTDDPAEPSLAVATPAGLSFLEHGSISSLYAFQGLVNNHVFTLAERSGTLYAGTLGGVSTLQRGLVQASFNTANSPLRQNWITASAVFGEHLYLGTYGSGVVRFDDGAMQSFASFANQRSEINLNALVATHRALYAGTSGQGLAILRAGDNNWQFVSEGLPSLNVTALDERDGRLYVGTDNGLVRVSENNLLP